MGGFRPRDWWRGGATTDGTASGFGLSDLWREGPPHGTLPEPGGIRGLQRSAAIRRAVGKGHVPIEAAGEDPSPSPARGQARVQRCRCQAGGGVRSLERFSHQALYEAGDFALDLRLDQEYGTTTVVLVGQISDRSQPTRKLTNLPVLLMSGGEILTRASSNQFGEFHLEYEPRGRLTLCAAVGNGKRIEVPLHGLASDRPNRKAWSLLKPLGKRRR